MKQFCRIVFITVVIVILIAVRLSYAESKSNYVYYNCDGMQYEFVKVKRPDTNVKRKLAYTKYSCKVWYVIDTLYNVRMNANGRLFVRGTIE